jgi:hypothetical protein
MIPPKLILPTTSGSLIGEPSNLRPTFREPLYIVSNRCGAGSTKGSFGVFCRAWTGDLLPFLVGSQDKCVDCGENLTLALGCGIRPSVVGDADPAHVIAFVTISQTISQLECRAAPPECINVRLNSKLACCS